MNRVAVAAAAALCLLASEASAKTQKWCMGTFIRDSCPTAGDPVHCSYPRKAGVREEFMGWEIDDGVRGYAVYRLAAYPAKDIRLDPGCRLPKYM